MTRLTHALASLLLLLPANVLAQEDAAVPPDLSAREAVKQGNRLLDAAEPARAVDFYRHAATRQPDSREIAFDEGLALYQLGRYEEARRKFQEAAAGKADALADDAIYSEGTSYHAEALTNPEDPKAAVARLEAAMQRYQSVLAGRPDHQAARDANYKAGMLWRRLKEQMQQQQQQSQPSDQNQENDDQDQQPQEQQPQDQQQQDQQEQQSQSQQDNDSSEQQQQQDTQSDNEQQRQQDEPNEESQEAQQQAAEAQQEQISREQAERKLREMMQAVRQRKKDRREPPQLIRVKPVDKDW
jgi:Ca-activated chloride channel family protein